VSRLLLDTTFVVDAQRGDDPGALAELRVGALLGRGKRAVARTAYVDDVVATIPVLPYDVAVAEAHAALLAEVRAQGRPRGAHDLIIAATARAGGRTVVTADAAAFAGLPGVAVVPHR
jgi:tRNA(fMet)-specific endonuclease VapC